MTLALRLNERFVHTYGRQKDGVWFYPSPDKVATFTVDELRELKLSTRKAEYIIGLSQKIASGDLQLDRLQRLTDSEVISEITKIRGIGLWTAENYLLFALGRPNLFPNVDIGIQNAVKKLYGLNRKPTIEELTQYEKNWEPYLSYASFYLWRSIETGSDKK
ncbi:DNA-3-methyladenine glycosylase family protein [Bacillus sp. 2205SS5-2]|uniref:DNA-3-methyladenine glycosylase family protein n=1 Tax=Bacillus sp. 2205SS5-2 TaxID=3109031 RepID=UPI00300483D2